MILVVQSQAPNVVAVLLADRTQQLLDSVHMFSDFSREDRAINQVRLDLFAFKAVKTDVAGRIDQLAQVDAVVFVGDEADDVGCFGRHLGGCEKTYVCLGLLKTKIGKEVRVRYKMSSQCSPVKDAQVRDK